MLLVSRRPTLFRHAEHFHNECGPYQLRAALNSLGKDALPADLYFRPFDRKRDWSLPYFMPSVLRRFGVKARLHVWLARSFRAHVIAALKRDRPVLFVLNSILGNGRLHWMSIWGYDESTDEFLCYDSQAPEAEGTPGNARYSADLLRARLPWHATATLTIEGTTY